MTAVLALAALLRLWALARPDQLVFDELYYVRDAVSQLAHGYPTVWPDDDPVFGGERARAFSDTASSVAHPPLGKWLIGLGILLLGPDSGWGWRIAIALAGIATVGLTMRLGWLLSRSTAIACLAGLLLAIDGVHVVLSRVALLDGFLTFFVILGAIFIWRDQLALRQRPALWRRPWLLAAGLSFGAAAAVKWSGLYALAAFLILVTVRDLLIRYRSERRALLGALRQALVAAAIALPAALLVYLASWTGWILHPGGQDRTLGEPWWEGLWRWHAHTLAWHSSLTAEHPYQAHPLGWPLGIRPTLMYWTFTEQGPGCPWSSGCAAAVTPVPNPLVAWAGVLALLLIAWALARALWQALRSRSLDPLTGTAALAFVLTGYLSGWLPWLITFGRSAVFQFYAVVLTPFSALALAIVLGSLAGLSGRPASESRPIATNSDVFALAGIRLDPGADAVRGRRIAVAIFAAACVVLGVLFFPLWSGMPVADWFWRAHLWLPGWR